MKWIDAIVKVLDEAGGPMHYPDIYEEIINKGYKYPKGPTPLKSLDSILSTNTDPNCSNPPPLFYRDERGFYGLTVDGKRLASRIVSSVASTVPPSVVVRHSSVYNPHDPNFKKVSDFTDFKDLSNEEKDLLDLIVNFRLPLVVGEVCFADILDKLEKVEFSDKEERRPQSIDASSLRKKLNKLREDRAKLAAKIDRLRQKGYNPKLQDLECLLKTLDSIADEIKDLLDKASSDIVEINVPVLGEFIPERSAVDKPKVVIYYRNIERFCESIDSERWDVMDGVFVHEMFHAWNYFKAGGKRSVLAIDEPMVEFEALYFLKELEAFASSQSHPLHDMVKSVSQDRAVIVRNKQKSIGDVAAYGFGYYLFEKLSKSNVDSIKWIDAYSKKSASIDGSNTLVGKAEKALIPIYPFTSEKKVMERFKEIIFDGHVPSVTTGESVVA